MYTRFCSLSIIIQFCDSRRHSAQMLSVLTNTNLNPKNSTTINFWRVRRILVVTWSVLRVVFLDLIFQVVLNSIHLHIRLVLLSVFSVFYRSWSLLNLFAFL